MKPLPFQHLNFFCRRRLTFLFFLALLNFLPLTSNADSLFAPQEIFILQQFIDNYEVGQRAGGNYTVFGRDFSAFVLSKKRAASGSTSIVLQTVKEGFRGKNNATEKNNFIGITKNFSFNRTSGKPGNAINAKGFTHLAYWVGVPNDSTVIAQDFTRFVTVQLSIGEEGAGGKPGAIWIQKVSDLSGRPKVISIKEEDLNPNAILPKISLKRIHDSQGDDGFVRILVPLNETGFLRIQGNSRLDLTDITKFSLFIVRDDEGGSDGQRTIFLDDILFMNLNKPHNLTVSSRLLLKDTDESFPITGIPFRGKADDISFTGTKGKKTNFREQFADTTSLELTTQEEFSKDGNTYRFSHWELQGRKQEDKLRTNTFLMLRGTTTVAVFKTDEPQYVLKVGSNLTDVKIEGSHPGTTNPSYFVTTDQSNPISIHLEAPEIVSKGSVYQFLYWTIAGENDHEELRQNAIDIVLDSNQQITAEYVRAQALLTVRSLPVQGIEVSNSIDDKKTTTDYALPVNGESVTLTASSTHSLSGDENIDFDHWAFLPADQAGLAETDAGVIVGDSVSVTRTVDTNTIAVAVYDSFWSLEPESWNLVSTPVNLDEPAVSQIAGLQEPVWRWSGKKFVIADALIPGEGYWVFNTASEKQTILLTGTEPASAKVDLELGWNLIGVKGENLIFHPKTASTQATTTPFTLPGSSKIAGDFWGWEGSKKHHFITSSIFLSLFRRNILTPAEGYWVYVRD